MTFVSLLMPNKRGFQTGVYKWLVHAVHSVGFIFHLLWQKNLPTLPNAVEIG